MPRQVILKTDDNKFQNMPQETSDHVPMTVWCTLIPPNEMGKLVKFEEDLRMVNQTYEDWLVSMRGKAIIGTNTGVLLDRIRILMINIGIACAMNRDLAEEIQAILSVNLRKRALGLVSQMPDEPPEKLAVKETLSAFFSELRFTRDIFPEEEIGKATPEKVKSFGKSGAKKGRFGKVLGSIKGSSKTVDRQKTAEAAVLESSNILKRIYMRLLSPDPWGDY
ncbi:MAG: hypothetical protein ACXAC0_04030 [Candidatus Thorarchaeota archaeon]|jgi:hypothetical protein